VKTTIYWERDVLGVIDAYNEVHEIGLIRSTDNEIFSFGPNEWDVTNVSPRLKMKVRFERPPPGSRWKKAYYIQPVQQSEPAARNIILEKALSY
jgi:hypothetical protein